MLPNTLIIGVQKSGTTFLSMLLRQHPDVFAPELKELHYFSSQKSRDMDLSWYEEFFDKYDGEKVVMEATPEYIASEDALLRIKKVLNKDIKIIIAIREPISRLISQYNMKFSKKIEKRDLNKVIQDSFTENETVFKNYVRRGLYYEQIEMVRSIFPTNRLHIVVFENLIKNTQLTMRNLVSYLEIDDTFIFNSDTIKNTGRKKMVNFLGKYVYRTPFWIRHKFSSLANHALKRRISSMLLSKNSPVIIDKINEENLLKLKEIYRNQICKLSKKYNLDFFLWGGKYWSKEDLILK